MTSKSTIPFLVESLKYIRQETRTKMFVIA